MFGALSLIERIYVVMHTGALREGDGLRFDNFARAT